MEKKGTKVINAGERRNCVAGTTERRLAGGCTRVAGGGRIFMEAFSLARNESGAEAGGGDAAWVIARGRARTRLRVR